MRGSALATACGLDYSKRSRRGKYRFLGWVTMPNDFEHYRVGEVALLCHNCLENLELGTGPQ